MVSGFTSCKDDTDPKLDTSKEYDFVLNIPPYANQFIDLSTNGLLEFTMSQPNYGLTLATNYNMELSLSPNFEPIINEPVLDADGVEHIVAGSYALTYESSVKGVVSYKMGSIATAINELYGEFDEASYMEKGAYEGPVYFRATASVGDGKSAELTAVTSNTITLANVLSFADFKPDVPEFISVPGNGPGWNHLKNLIWDGELPEDKIPVFRGFAYISGEFKLTDGDWDDYGNWGLGDEETITDEGNGVYTMELIQGSQTNFNKEDMIQAGLYYMEVALTKYKVEDGKSSGTLTLTYIDNIAVCGDFNGWDTGSAIQLTPSENFDTFTGTASVTEAGWKFVFNNGWGINLGTSKIEEIEDLWFDGDNIYEGGSTITLKLKEYPWTCDVQ